VKKRVPSLKRRLIFQPLVFQFVAFFVSTAVVLSLIIRLDSGGPYTDERITPIIADAIVRGNDGRLAVRMTPELRELQANTHDLWFVAEDDSGRSVSFGKVPSQYASHIGRLHNFSYAHLRNRLPPYRLAAVIRREIAPAGALTILGHGELSELTFVVVAASNIVAIPIFMLLALVTLIATPWIVNRSLAGVGKIAREAEQIDTQRRGRRLSEEEVPREIVPLVKAVNDALRRLDEGYERQRRFIASAAHELRTPIAILRLKVETADESATRRLSSEVERLANLAEQLLDLQRLDADRTDDIVDLAALVRRVAGDLAPLLIASDRTIQVLVDDARPIVADAGALERVVTNLVQNAIEHGGRHVSIRVFKSTFEVEDDGPGIPVEDRERVFEPFQRLRPRSTGSGLGLNLVQQVVECHQGRVSIRAAPGGGTIVHVEFPHYICGLIDGQTTAKAGM
jgi:two-component system, OmpR family, sensor histidine kinase TctE